MVTVNSEQEVVAPSPPSYEQSVASDAPPALPVESAPLPPPDAQRVIAPFIRAETNTAIYGKYVVKLSENNKTGPDVDLQTTNGAIDITLFLHGTLPRPTEINTRGTNGRGIINIASRESPVHLSARSSNGRIEAILPRDFNGLISLRTTLGAKSLSEQLANGAIIYPNAAGSDSKTITYLIRPKTAEEIAKAAETALGDTKDVRGDVALKQPETAAEGSQQNDDWQDAEPGPDRVTLFTSNGAAHAKFVGEVEKSESWCVIM